MPQQSSKAGALPLVPLLLGGAKVAGVAAKLAARRLPLKLIGSTAVVSKVVENKWEAMKLKLAQQEGCATPELEDAGGTASTTWRTRQAQAASDAFATEEEGEGGLTTGPFQEARASVSDYQHRRRDDDKFTTNT